MKIDIERLINLVTEEYDAFSDYKKIASVLYRGSYKEIQERRNHLEYARIYFESCKSSTDAVCEVFRLDAEQRRRLYIVARAVNHWHIATNWGRLIPDNMKKQIVGFVFGTPVYDVYQQRNGYWRWFDDDQIGLFEIV